MEDHLDDCLHEARLVAPHDLVRDVGYRPAMPIEEGVRRFVDWFCDYYGYRR